VVISQNFGAVLALEFGERITFGQAPTKFVDELPRNFRKPRDSRRVAGLLFPQPPIMNRPFTRGPADKKLKGVVRDRRSALRLAEPPLFVVEGRIVPHAVEYKVYRVT
jgi:hypothetical protein